jgi:hypothetical protein
MNAKAMQIKSEVIHSIFIQFQRKKDNARQGERTRKRLIFASIATTALILGALPTPAGAVHQWFEDARNWTGGVPFYGADPWHQTLFADVSGGGKADAIAIKEDGVWVRYSDGCRFGPEQKLTSTPFAGTVQTLFADVTGDKKADGVAIDRDSVTVRRSEDNRRIKTDTFGYSHDTPLQHYLADIDDDGKADLIAYALWGVVIHLSKGDGEFKPNWEWTLTPPFHGDLSVHFADVTGDGAADAIAVNYSSIIVHTSFGDSDTTLSPFTITGHNWTPDGPLYGDRWEFFVDVTGDGAADLVLDNWAGLAVRHALPIPGPGRFAGLTNGQLIIAGDMPRLPGGYWTEKEFFGNNGGTGFADFDGDGDSEPVAINHDGLWVRRNTFKEPISSCR